MMDWQTIGTFASLAVAGVTVLGFWLGLSDRISRAAGEAKAARAEAAEAKTAAAALGAAFSLYREQIAREYIQRDVMQQVETRLSEHMRDTEERIMRVLEGLVKRLDHFVVPPPAQRR